MNDDEFDPYYEWLGIPPQERPADHYRLLGLSRVEVENEVISNAVDRLIAYVQTFKHGPHGQHTQQLLDDLAAAQRTLLQPEAKAKYDQQLLASSPDDAAALLPPANTPPANTPPANTPPANTGATNAAAKSGLEAGAVNVGDALDDSDAREMHAAARTSISRSQLPTARPLNAPPMPPGAAPPVQHATKSPTEKTGSSTSGSSVANRGQDSAAAAARTISDRRQSSATRYLPAIMMIVGIFVVAGSVWLVGSWFLDGAKDEGIASVGGNAQGKAGSSKSSAVRGPDVVLQQDLHGLQLRPSTARLHGPNIELQTEGADDVLDNWLTKEDYVSWQFNIVAPSTFRATMTYRVEPDGLEGEYEVVLNGTVTGTSTVQQDADTGFVTDEFMLPIKRANKYTLAIKPRNKPGNKFMILQALDLIPQPTSKEQPNKKNNEKN